jgi:hypothetical protein
MPDDLVSVRYIVDDVDTAIHFYTARRHLNPANDTADQPVGPGTVLREWGRIGCFGFCEQPTHITLLRDLCETADA